MLKNMADEGYTLLKNIWEKSWDEANIPEDWKIGAILLLHKKGESKTCQNYRKITLLNVWQGL